jgi:ribosome biogenesis GTPase A
MQWRRRLAHLQPSAPPPTPSSFLSPCRPHPLPFLLQAREHERKQRRAAKKNPALRKKLTKDPGIPNLNPFKAQILKRMEDQQKLLKFQDASRQRRAQEIVRRGGKGGARRGARGGRRDAQWERLTERESTLRAHPLTLTPPFPAFPLYPLPPPPPPPSLPLSPQALRRKLGGGADGASDLIGLAADAAARNSAYSQAAEAAAPGEALAAAGIRALVSNSRAGETTRRAF